MLRALDLMLSSIAMLCFSPILLPLMLVLRLTGEGEVFYVQTRVGRNERPFGLFKFATMLKNSPKIGAGEITVKNDPRILPLGGFLRKSKLNELPQLWNIFVGDMSVVGPRPMLPNAFSHYPETSKPVISSVRPGLTGIGSIIFRDEERYLDGLADPNKFYREVITPYKAALEVWYVQNQSVALYLKIIVVTAWVVVSPSSKSAQSFFSGLPPLPQALAAGSS